MSRVAPALRQAAGLVGVAAILLFFSEFFFFNEGMAGQLVGVSSATRFEVLAEAVLFYALFTVPFLAAVAWFRVASLSGLFLAGCLYGWATEGAVIALVYENLPFSYVWPSVGWHALVEIFVALILLPRALDARRRWVAPLVCLGLGAAWGYCVTWVLHGEDAIGLGQFAAYALWAFLPVPLGLALLSVSGADVMTLNRRAGLLMSLAVVALAVLMAATHAPLGGLGLGLLVVVTLLALRGEPTVAGQPLIRIGRPSARWLSLALCPLAAVAAYGLAERAGAVSPAELVFPFLLVCGAAIFVGILGLRFYRSLRHAFGTTSGKEFF